MACWEGGKPGLSRTDPAHPAGRWAVGGGSVDCQHSLCLPARLSRPEQIVVFTAAATLSAAAPGVGWPSRRQCCRHSSALIASITWFFTSPSLEVEFLVIEIAAIS